MFEKNTTIFNFLNYKPLTSNIVKNDVQYMRCETHMKSDGILCFCVIYRMSLRHASQHADVALYNTLINARMAGSAGVYFKFQIFAFFSSMWIIWVTLLRLLCVVFDVSNFGHPFICKLCGLTEMDHFSKNLYLCSSEERVIYMCGNFIFGWSIALRFALSHTYISTNILVNSVISIIVNYL